MNADQRGEAVKTRSRKYTAVMIREGDGFVAHCVELGVVSQGEDVEAAKANLQEAVELYLESFDDVAVPQSTSEFLVCPLEVNPVG